MTESNTTSPAVATPPVATPLIRARFSALDVALVAVMIMWGVNFVVIKSTVETAPIFVFNAVRFSMGTLVIGVIFKLNGVSLVMPRREWLPLIFVALLGALFQILFVTGLRNTTVANNALIVTTAPVWVVLFNVLRRQERISRAAVLGVFMALGGVTLVIASRNSGQLALGGPTTLGDVLSVVASWVWAVSILISRRPLQRNPTLPTTFWVMLWGSIFQFVLAVPDLVRLDWSLFNGTFLLACCYAGVISAAFGSIIWNRSVKQFGASRTAVYTYLEPIVAAIAATIFLGEAFTLWLVIGAVFVLLGLAIVKKA